MKFFFPLALLAMLLLTQCNNDATTTEATAVEEQSETTPPPTPEKQVTQIDESAISPSEILKNNEAAYLALRKKVTSNLDAINNKIDSNISNSAMKEGLKNGFQEIVKYDNIYDIAKKSETIDAETIEQFMKGLESQLVKLGVQ